MDEPIGKLMVVGASQRRPPNRDAVYANVIVLDDAGTKWSFEASCFCFDLKPTLSAIDYSKTQILKEVLKGLDPYLSTGVPEVYWKLAVDLTREIYGEPGVALLESGHKTYEPQFDHKDTTVLHSFEGWPDPNTQVLPEDLIKLLEALTPE